jgi:glycosyltransferase involved in cell wall biosynthesis
MPKVSVVIPVYGVEKYIERCARSLFEQTLDDMEFIFIDDCTPDKSIDILKDVLKDYSSRIKQTHIVKMQANMGQARVRRIGIQSTTGDYIIHCDSDDWVDPDIYKIMLNKALSENLDIVICDYYKSNGTAHRIFKGLDNKIYQDKNIYFSMLLKGQVSTAVWNKLVRRQIYFSNDIIYPVSNMWEDFVFNVQLTYYSQRVGHINSPLYYYFTNQSSICHSDIEQRIPQVLDNSNLILEFIYSRGLDKIYKDELLYFKYYSRSELILYVRRKKYRIMWKNIYPEINAKFCFSNAVSFREKLKFISIYCGLYPIIICCMKTFKNYKDEYSEMAWE